MTGGSTSMRAAVCRKHGDYRDLIVEDLPRPVPGPREILIDVAASGVSFANILAIAGRHQNRSDPPFIPGTEVAGIVRACGEGVDHLRPGDRVVAAVRNGGFAEGVCSPDTTVFKIPTVLPFDEAVLFPTIYGTAYAALTWYARLQAGETVLVHGSGGATGLAAVEIARSLGARVIATASSPEKRATALRHGASVAIDYTRDGFRDQVLDLTGGRGADVIFDPVGGAVLSESMRCIAPEGRLLPIGFAGGDIPQIPASLILVKNIAVLGVYWGYHFGWAKVPPKPGNTERVRTLFTELFDLYERGALRPTIQRRLPITEFAAALALIEERQVIGKVVLDCSPGDELSNSGLP
ncbi:NADPH:quinone oxidoreductase family protein [Methylobacterium sp. J-030]|uniref:NADPH:quinone oxidoreductase family protein n=1 Tax=Methylobacterium sp. J-030 TaxID=2836627 RepID=UPI001FBBE056|nr:NADPH:quinone oxidoreductase family protein [Methylobacterium sp. J-030]MCJ2072195.1 NADPH:quinone oxidoreductase family protein [Methylobacterium sp. J-030]